MTEMLCLHRTIFFLTSVCTEQGNFTIGILKMPRQDIIPQSKSG